MPKHYAALAAGCCARYAYGGLRCPWRGLRSSALLGERARFSELPFVAPPFSAGATAPLGAACAGTGEPWAAPDWDGGGAPPVGGLLSRLPMALGWGLPAEPGGGGWAYCGCPSARGCMSGAMLGWS